jgi:hypothetical protein
VAVACLTVASESLNLRLFVLQRRRQGKRKMIEKRGDLRIDILPGGVHRVNIELLQAVLRQNADQASFSYIVNDRVDRQRVPESPLWIGCPL